MRPANELTPHSPILRNQTFSPTCACHVIPPYPSCSSQFARFPISANSHVVHDVSCKTGNPAEQRIVICNARAGVLFSWDRVCPALSFHFSYNHLHTTRGLVITLKVGPAQPLPLHHNLGSPRLEVISCPIHYHISK